MTREDTFERWLRCYEHDVLRTCLLLLSDRGLAEDALQDAFLKVWRSMDRYEGRNDSSVRTWILAIAINTCRDRRRSMWFRRRTAEQPLDGLELPDSAIPQEARETLIDVMKLPEGLREAVILHHYHGLTKTETAAAMRIGRATLDRRLQKAYAALGYREEVHTDEE